jgi:hypothetical protein
LWLMASTIRELRQGGQALLWPEQAICPHGEHAST